MKLAHRNKEDLFNSLSEWHTKCANILDYCGIKPTEIREWIEHTNKAVHLREAFKYAKKNMDPAVDNFCSVAGRDMTAWKVLKVMDPGNQKLKVIKVEVKKVLNVWESRPKGRLLDAPG